jgi:hypothetical protein
MTQEWFFLDLELTLAKLGVKLVLSQLLKYNSDLFFVFFHNLQIYKNVVNEYHDKLVQFWYEDRLHELHEVCRHIFQPKRHHKILIETISCRQRHLGYVFRTSLDLVIALQRSILENTCAPTS